MTWAWNFGDGVNASGQNMSHTYGSGGTYAVALTVTDNDGGIDSSSQQVTVSAGGGTAGPVANFTYSCSGRDCSFNSTSSGDLNNNSYFWDLGDGSFSTLAIIPSHIYAPNANYTVTLTVTDTADVDDSANASFRVKNRGNTSGSTGGDSGGDSGDGGGTTGGSEKGRKKCNDGIDNDGDDLIDRDDPDCQ
jgi:PKD repeat protein